MTGQCISSAEWPISLGHYIRAFSSGHTPQALFFILIRRGQTTKVLWFDTSHVSRLNINTEGKLLLLKKCHCDRPFVALSKRCAKLFQTLKTLYGVWGLSFSFKWPSNVSERRLLFWVLDDFSVIYSLFAVPFGWTFKQQLSKEKYSMI